MDWDDPQARLRLIESVGARRYNEMMAEHQKKSVVATANGHDIRPVGSRFGTLFAVGGTNLAFATLAEAVDYASKN